MTNPMTPEQFAKYEDVQMTGKCLAMEVWSLSGSGRPHAYEQAEAIGKLREALGPFYLHQRALEKMWPKWKPGDDWSQNTYSTGASHLTWGAFLQAAEALAETATFEQGAAQ